MVTPQEVSFLNKIKTKTRTISLYLNTDQEFYTQEEIFITLKELLKKVKNLIDVKAYKRINDRLKLRLKKEIRGMAFFMNPEENIWYEYEFSKPFLSKIYAEYNLHLKPFVNMLDEYERYCTVVVDKETARIFQVFLGRITEFSYIFDEFPGKHAQGGWSQRGQEAHIEVHVKRHLKKVADQTLKFFKQNNFDRLIISGSKEILSEFIDMLHPYLKNKVAGQFLTEMFMPKEHFLKQSLAIEEKIERQKEKEMISELEDNLGPNNKGIAGLEAVLNAAQKREILKLFINVGYREPGWRCMRCDNLYPMMKYKKCLYCGGKLEKVEDVVDELVQKVLAQNAKVEFVKANEPLKKLGNIGALLRFG